MLVVIDVQTKLLKTDEIASVFKALVEAVAEQNRVLIQKLGLPSLYKSGVQFRNEPNAGRFENIASAPVVLQRGWGDCDDLIAYRVGELRASGEPATARVYWREHATPGGRKVRLFHVEVRRANGDIEDPSRLIGM